MDFGCHGQPVQVEPSRDIDSRVGETATEGVYVEDVAAAWLGVCDGTVNACAELYRIGRLGGFVDRRRRTRLGT